MPLYKITSGKFHAADKSIKRAGDIIELTEKQATTGFRNMVVPVAAEEASAAPDGDENTPEGKGDEDAPPATPPAPPPNGTPPKAAATTRAAAPKK